VDYRELYQNRSFADSRGRLSLQCFCEHSALQIKITENKKMTECYLCPRLCGARREAGEYGFCSQGAQMRVARASLHMFEEPPISAARGSGTVFFSGCSLRCVFCQNRAISRADCQNGKTDIGKEVSIDGLCEIFFSLKEQGAHNINLVTPTHFADKIAIALSRVKDRLAIPVIYNSSGYERVETLKMLEGLVDIYMPDMKYGSSECAERYSSAPDYVEVAAAAISEMFRQTGEPRFDNDGLLLRGTLVRHLVLPSHRKDSMLALDILAKAVPPEKVLLSVMSQYTPDFALDCPYENLHRRLTSFEYNSVVDHAASLGFSGFTQSLSSASSSYTPDF
jgi:putative pyruvate formate lyase activating enzyme